MITKKTIILVSLMSALLPVYAQYESFFGQEYWEYNIAYLETCKDYDPNLLGLCCTTEAYAFSKSNRDTIAENEYYKSNIILLREDSINGVLYAKYLPNETDYEYVLCDLSLAVGDTFFYRYFPQRDIVILMIVDSINYVSQRKTLHLSIIGDEYYSLFYTPFYGFEDYNVSLRFMEGVGPIFGVRQASFFDEDLGLLLCMHKDDSLVYMTYEDLGCYQIGGDVPFYSQSHLQVYPNPTDDILYVELSGAGIKSVGLYDLQGRVVMGVFDTPQPGNAAINVRSVPAGVYVLRVTDENGKEYHRKVVVR